MPGSYHLQVLVDQSQIVSGYYYVPVATIDPDNTYPCLSPELVIPLLGLKPK